MLKRVGSLMGNGVKTAGGALPAPVTVIEAGDGAGFLAGFSANNYGSIVGGVTAFDGYPITVIDQIAFATQTVRIGLGAVADLATYVTGFTIDGGDFFDLADATPDGGSGLYIFPEDYNGDGMWFVVGEEYDIEWTLV